MAIYRVTLYPTTSTADATSFNIEATDLTDADAQVAGWLADKDRIVIEKEDDNTQVSVLSANVTSYGTAGAPGVIHPDAIHVEDDRIHVISN